MNHDSSSAPSQERSLSELVEKACRRWQAQQQPGAAQRELSSRASAPFTIALSREVGTQGTSVAREVGRILDWPVYDHELLERIAQDMGIRATLHSTAWICRREQSWLLESVAGFLSSPEKNEWSDVAYESAYVHHLVETVHALGIHGECVIVGRGATFILPAATTLRVRLVGPVRERIAAVSRQLGISERDAARRVRTTDRERIDFVQDHFFKDPSDPRNYDLLLNASRLSVCQNAGIIVETLRCLQGREFENRTRSSPLAGEEGSQRRVPVRDTARSKLS